MGVKKTTKQFIEEAIKVHGDKYDYSLVNYIASAERVEIYCNIHNMVFLQKPSVHLRGSNCPQCANSIGREKTRLTTEKFIKKAKSIYGDLYDYSSITYTDCNSEVSIICEKHGSFQKKAKDFLYGVGCNTCSKEVIDKTNLSVFIEKAIKKHGTNYSYENTRYTGNSGKVTVFCKLRGEIEVIPSVHLAEQVRPENATTTKRVYTTKTTEQFILKAKKIHGDRYSYEDSEYRGSGKKVEIICSTHGNFKQVSSDHLKGSGCPKCALLRKGGTYSRSDYIKKADGRMCTFYTLRCFNEEEWFYKIGITMNTIKMRYGGNTMPYEYEVISEIKGSAGFIWDLERDEKRKLKTLHYRPKLDFGGSKNECFTDYKI